MLYPSDFHYFRGTSEKRKLVHQAFEKNPEKKHTTIKSFWEGYCLQTSVHGVKYITEKDSHKFEKIIWAILVIMAVIGTAWVCFLLSQRFQDSPLETVVESTIFPIYEISFPAVTICVSNRINWKREQKAIEKYIPNASNETISQFRTFLINLENIEFGAFELFDRYKREELEIFDHINLSELLEFLMHQCEEILFVNCWWRNKIIPCCKAFVKQKSEYGWCHAFNSAVNDVGQKRLQRESNFPWRTSGFGDWSGLRGYVYIDPKYRNPYKPNQVGVLVSVHNPGEWPTSAYFVPVGTAAAVNIKSKYTYAMESTRRLPPDERECLFKDETQSRLNKTLAGHAYLRRNCLAQCRQFYMKHFCNCTMEMFYPIGNFTPCKASDLICLSKYDQIFNYEKPIRPNKYFHNDEPGMTCHCLFECKLIEYKMEVSTINLWKLSGENLDNYHDRLLLDVHFQDATIIKYRTDVVFGWLDLMVSFGGIAGLFLGCSILSAAELLYFLTVGFAVYMDGRTKKHSTRVHSIKSIRPKIRSSNSNIHIINMHRNTNISPKK